MTIDANDTLANIVLSHPGAARVFEKAGLDYCCGGQQPLAAACARQGIDVAEVIGRITELAAAGSDQRDWRGAPLEELLDYILDTHHEYTREALARLEPLMTKVRTVHGDDHPELADIARVFGRLLDDLLPHLMKEENVLFPYIRKLDHARRGVAPAPAAHFGTVANPISMMNFEHDEAGEMLKQLRTLSHGYTPPADACGSYRALFQGLEELEHDLMQHIHLENHLVFPQALELEQTLR